MKNLYKQRMEVINMANSEQTANRRQSLKTEEKWIVGIAVIGWVAAFIWMFGVVGF